MSRIAESIAAEKAKRLDKAQRLLTGEAVFVSSVRVLLNAEDGAGFRNWFRDTYEEGYAHDGMTAGEVTRAMLMQRLEYLAKLGE